MSDLFWSLPVIIRQVIALTLCLAFILIFFHIVTSTFSRLASRQDKKNAIRQENETDDTYTVIMSGMQVSVWFLFAVLGLMFAGIGLLSHKANPSNWDNNKMFFVIAGIIIGISLLGYLYTLLWKIQINGCTISVRSRHTFFLKRTMTIYDLDDVHHTKMFHQLDIRKNRHRIALVNLASHNEEQLIRTLQKYGKYHEDQDAIISDISKKIEKNEKKWR